MPVFIAKSAAQNLPNVGPVFGSPQKAPSSGVLVDSAAIERHHGLKIHIQNGLCVVQECSLTVPQRGRGACRGEISEFSLAARCRMRRYLRNSVADYSHFATLTYPAGYPHDGRIVKGHLRRMIQEVRRCWDRDDVAAQPSIFWFLEFQERGAPHFHLFLTRPLDIGWLSRRWYEIVGSEDERHLRAGTNIQRIKSGRAGSIAYCMKYANKSNQKAVPENYEHVGRFWGVSGQRDVVVAATFIPDSCKDSTLVKHMKNDIFKYIKACLEEENEAKGMRIYKSSLGTRVLVFKSQEIRRELMRMVGLLSIAVGAETDGKWVDDQFIDAEVDFNA